MAEETKGRILLAGGLLWYPSMKQEQMDVASLARAFLEGKDVFAVLPTGFGKSLHVLYMPTCSTRYFEEKLRARLFYCIVVITPLIATVDKPGKMFLS